MHNPASSLVRFGCRTAVIASALCSFACTPTRPTEIVAGVTTQMRVPDDLNSVAMVVQVGGKIVFCNQYPVTDGTARLPGTLGVLGASGKADTLGSVTVKVVGLRDDSEFCFVDTLPKNTMVIRSRRVTFVDDQIKFLPLPLKESCADVVCNDNDGETCVAGKCVAAEVDSATLQNYSDSLIFGNTNTCFDATNCMAKKATLPVLVDDADNCTFRIPLPEGTSKPTLGNLNVRLFYKTLGSEILDLDPADTKKDQQEGFALGGKQNTATFRLAPNLCESNYKEQKILAIDSSALCPAKRPLQPICDDYVAPKVFTQGTGLDGSGSSGGDSPGEDADESVCTLAGLQPVESAVYVLMDRSFSMRKFFGDGGLSFAVGLPLSSPVAKRTKIGFGLLPPAAELCGTNDYSAEIPLGNVDDTRDAIGALLENRDGVLTDDPSQFFLEAALQGAYQTVASLQPTGDGDAAVFNRRAVVVISNRDTLAGSCPGTSAVDLAERAFASETEQIFTYAIALDSGETSALDSATQIAEAGGTRVFNGVADEKKGARAVNDILTELGTCLYQVKRSDSLPDEPLPASASIAYMNPNAPTKKAVNIAHNADCSEATADQTSGWNLDRGLVRLCGQDCEDLRKVVGDVAVFHAAQAGHALPAVPLVATAPCDEFRR